MARANPAEAAAKRESLRKTITSDKPISLGMMPMGPGGAGRIAPTNPNAETTHEAYRGAKWTIDQVRKVLKHHSIDTVDDFVKEAGTRATYSAKKVLDWLGY